MKTFVFIAIVGLSLGFGLALVTMRSTRAPAGPSTTVAAPACAPGVTVDDLAALGAELRAELRAAGPRDTAPPTAASPR